MICFNDRTYCSSSSECKTECDLIFTNEDYKQAMEWWNKGKDGSDEPPICFVDYKDTEYCPGFKEKGGISGMEL